MLAGSALPVIGLREFRGPIDSLGPHVVIKARKQKRRRHSGRDDGLINQIRFVTSKERMDLEF